MTRHARIPLTPHQAIAPLLVMMALTMILRATFILLAMNEAPPQRPLTPWDISLASALWAALHLTLAALLLRTVAVGTRLTRSTIRLTGTALTLPWLWELYARFNLPSDGAGYTPGLTLVFEALAAGLFLICYAHTLPVPSNDDPKRDAQ